MRLPGTVHRNLDESLRRKLAMRIHARAAVRELLKHKWGAPWSQAWGTGWVRTGLRCGLLLGSPQPNPEHRPNNCARTPGCATDRWIVGGLWSRGSVEPQLKQKGRPSGARRPSAKTSRAEGSESATGGRWLGRCGLYHAPCVARTRFAIGINADLGS